MDPTVIEVVAGMSKRQIWWVDSPEFAPSLAILRVRTLGT